MKTSTLKNCLLSTLLYLGLPSASLSQIYNVGSDDGFSFSCAGSSGNEIFLPVSHKQFKAQCTTQGIRVYWEFTETKSDRIVVIEKSMDGKTFHPCHGSIRPFESGFEYIDYSSADETRYYRLKIQSPNQIPEYSQIIASVCNSRKNLISPNPSKGIFSISFGEPNSQIFISDVAGKQVLKTTILHPTEPINVSHLKAGIYNLEYASGETRLQQRIIITK